MQKNNYVAILSSFLFFGILSYCIAEEHPTLRFGMSTVLSGPAAELGLNMERGVRLAFERKNRMGGSKGRKLELIALDDGYEPTRTAPNMRQLIQNEKVLGIIGNVGTPTAIAAVPIALEQKTLFFAPFTGAGVLRKSPPDRYVFNYRASYAEETGAMIDALVTKGELKPEEIAFFTQRDGYGDAGFAGGIAALKRHGLKREGQITHGRYERNTVAIENGLADVLSSVTTPRAIIMVGAYAPCAEFIKQAKENGLKALYLNVSFVGSEALAEKLGALGEGVIVTQVVPPLTSDASLVSEYKQDLQTQESTASFGSLEGYIAGRILSVALERTENYDREGLIQAFERLGKFDIGLGVDLELDADNHQASSAVWPTVIRNGEFELFDWPNIKEMMKHTEK